MRPIPIVLSLAGMTLLGCGFLLWSTLQGNEPNPVLLGTTLAFATVLLVLPWSLGILRPAGVGKPCHDCGRPLSTELRTGFCIYCGCFVNAQAARSSARRV